MSLLEALLAALVTSAGGPAEPPACPPNPPAAVAEVCHQERSPQRDRSSQGSRDTPERQSRLGISNGF